MQITLRRIGLLAGIAVFSVAGYAGLHVLARERRPAVRARGNATLAMAPVAPSAAKSSAASDPNAPVLYFAKDPDPAPPFEGRDLSGQLVSSAALKGKVVILNFWATWCGPCREEIPEMIALQNRYKGKLAVIGASEDEIPPTQVLEFAKKIGINYPVIMATGQLEEAYGGVVALPTSFLIDPQGRVVQKNVGVYPQSFYELEVRSLMGMPVNARVETFVDTGQIFLKNADRATELPGVSFVGLSPAQRKIALRRLNTEKCTCGCDLTLAECRISDPSCPISLKLAQKIGREILHPGAPKTTDAVTSGVTHR